jgi:hypothetical protein
MPGSYSNFMMRDAPGPARIAYAGNLGRLERVKRAYDPEKRVSPQPERRAGPR